MLLRRALAEPPPAAERPGLLLELGIAEATAGQPAGEDHLREALDARRRRRRGWRSARRWCSRTRSARAGRIEDAVAIVDRTAARLRPADAQSASCSRRWR